jgi:hypothetical protein
MRKRNLVNLHVYASQTVKKKCMKPVMVRLKDLLTTVYPSSPLVIFCGHSFSVFAFNFNCPHTCIINSQLPPYTRRLNFTEENNHCRIIGDEVVSLQVRYFRYAKYRISIFLKYRYLSKISIYRNCLLVYIHELVVRA